MTFLILIGYEALSLTVAMVVVSEWQVVIDDKFYEMGPCSRLLDFTFSRWLFTVQLNNWLHIASFLWKVSLCAAVQE